MKFFFGKIRHQIMAGTLILCIIMIAVGFSTIRYVKQVSHQVSELTDNLSLQMTLSRDIAAKTILSRVHANAYVGEQSQQHLNEFIRNHRDLNTLIDTLEPMARSSHRGPILENIRTSVLAYGKAFGRVVQLIRLQQTILASEMIPSQYRIDSRFSALRTGIPGKDTLQQFLALGNVQMAWMQMVNHSIQYAQNKNERHAVLFNKYFVSAQKDLSSLIHLFQEDSLERKNAREAHKAMDRFSTGFEKIHLASIELNQLLKTTCKNLEAQINEAVEASVKSIETEYKAQNIASKEILTKSWFLLFAAIVMSLVVGTLISFFIASKITTPIHRLMHASRNIADRDLHHLAGHLTALSKGDLEQDFHISAKPLQIRQNNEVGQMADAFDDIVHQLAHTEKAFARMKAYLRYMADTSTSVANGDLSVETVVISEKDELGNAIATMVNNLRASHTKVQQYQNHQQELVEKKTAQLKATNSQLQKFNRELNREIEERKEAQDALQKNRQQLNLALQAAVMGIWQWEPSTGTMALSGEHPALLGIDRNMFKNTLEDFKAYIHPEDREGASLFFKAISSEKTADSFTYRVVWPDGTIKWMQSHGKAIWDDTARIHRIVGTTQDITQRILADQEHSEKKKLAAVMETAGAVCHELNQPLQIISGCCELLNETPDLSPGTARKLAMIDQQVKRMTTLNHNLMNITSYRTKAYLTSTIIDISESSRKKEVEET